MDDDYEDNYDQGQYYDDFDQVEYDPMTDYEWDQIQQGLLNEIEYDDFIWQSICEYVDNKVVLRNDKSDFKSCQDYVNCMLR